MMKWANVLNEYLVYSDLLVREYFYIVVLLLLESGYSSFTDFGNSNSQTNVKGIKSLQSSWLTVKLGLLGTFDGLKLLSSKLPTRPSIWKSHRDKHFFTPGLPCSTPGLWLEWAESGRGQKVRAGGLRCPPGRLRPSVGSPGGFDLPPVLPQQAEPGRHHRSGPPGCREQRRVPLLPDQERRAPHQHQLRRVGRGLRHGLPASTLRGNSHQDHPGRQPLQLQRCGVDKDRRSGGQAVSGAQVQWQICVIGVEKTLQLQHLLFL